MMKKMLSLCLAVCLLLGCALSAGAEGVSYPLDGGNEPLTILMGIEGNAPNAGYANWNETEFVKTWIEKREERRQLHGEGSGRQRRDRAEPGLRRVSGHGHGV